MTAITLKKKVHEYVETTDDKILKAVYTILEAHAKTKKEASALSTAQKRELDKRMKLFEAGKMEVYDWKDVYPRAAAVCRETLTVVG